MNTLVDVLVATAGTGSRMKGISEGLHKGLLPYNDKPVLWHILNQVPLHLQVGVLVGHKANQIQDFCELAFPKREFIFIEIDDWLSERAGTAYSLSCAKGLVSPIFWYLPCDGIFEEPVFSHTDQKSIYFISEISPEDSHKYQTFEIGKNHEVTAAHSRISGKVNSFAFTGIMRISDSKEFFKNLEASGEKEFAAAIPLGSLTVPMNSWQDLGNEEEYLSALAKTQAFNFTKPNEFTFVLEDIILKWWNDSNSAEEKLTKPTRYPTPYPSSVRVKGEFLAYQKATGSSFYESVTEENFVKLLSWLKAELWYPEQSDISEDCSEFYERKTLSRFALMNNRLSAIEYRIRTVDGISVGDTASYLGTLDWAQFVDKAVSTTIHGDLQFDNIIFNRDTSDFKLIDWRSSFGNQTILGDIYYDFAKLLGGIRLNYKLVKENQFEVQNESGQVSLRIPLARNANALEKVLEQEVTALGLDFLHVQKLVPIIYWNMAPLHAEPFSLFLWALGMKQFEITK